MKLSFSFDDTKVYQNFVEESMHHLLSDLVYWCFSAGLLDHMHVTSAFRSGDKGVHGTEPFRGLDIRSHEMSDPQSIVDKINAHWQYDSARPEKKCAMFHNVNNKGWHIHLQVHPNTIIVKGGW